MRCEYQPREATCHLTLSNSAFPSAGDLEGIYLSKGYKSSYSGKSAGRTGNHTHASTLR